jgi:hypothetical protein
MFLAILKTLPSSPPFLSNPARVIASLVYFCCFSCEFMAFSSDSPSFSIFLRASKNPRIKLNFPQTSLTFIVDCSKFLFDLISFISIVDCYFHPKFFSSYFIYFQCAIRQVFVFHLTRFDVVSSTFLCGSMRKRA